jgi:hypothetical protein
MTDVFLDPLDSGGARDPRAPAGGTSLYDAVHRWHLRNARACLRADDLESALRWSWGAADVLTDPRCARLVSPALESLLLALAERLPVPGPWAGRAAAPRRWLHVLTRTYPVGGHTALATRWIRSDPDGDRHSVMVLAQEGDPPSEALLAAARATGGQVWVQGPELGLLERATRLRAAAWDGHDVVVLHVHPQDVTAGVAFGVPGGPPVVFLNHADHIFWVGGGAADLVVHIRPLAEEWTRRYRGTQRTALLPIPLPAGDPDGPSPQERAAARQELGLPPEARVLLSIGNDSKYPPIPGADFVPVAEEVLRACPGAYVLVVGPREDRRWRAGRERSGGRLRVYAPRPDLGPFHAAADVYLDPIPMGSLTAFLEVARRGIPCVLAPRSCPYPLYPEDGALAALERPPDLAGYLQQVRALVAAPEERRRQGAALARAVRAEHCGAGWQRHLAALKGRLPGAHRTYPVPSPPPLPDAYAAYWRQARGPVRPDELLAGVLLPSARLRPRARLDRPLWRAVLWHCRDAPPEAGAGLLDLAATLGLLYRPCRTTLYLDTGGGFNGAEAHTTTADTVVRRFAITFDLPGAPAVRRARWDPLELGLCRVRLDHVEYTDRAGRVTRLDPSALVSNGAAAPDGFHDFSRTLDPMFYLPGAGELARVTLRGEWEVSDLDTVLRCLHAQLTESQALLHGRAEEIRGRDAAVRALREVAETRGEALKRLAAEIRDRDSAARTLCEQAEERDAAVRALREVAEACDEALKLLAEEVRDRDSEARTLREQAEERDAAVRALREVAEARGEALKRLAAEIERRDHILHEITQSRGWRLLNRVRATLNRLRRRCG